MITDYPNEMAAGIHEVCHHGASIMHAMGAFERKDHYMVYSVISSADIKKVKMKINEIDPKAFVNTIRSQDITGHFYMRPKD